jgi:membrane carboxypeptidase/penicillin-binding protein
MDSNKLPLTPVNEMPPELVRVSVAVSHCSPDELASSQPPPADSTMTALSSQTGQRLAVVGGTDVDGKFVILAKAVCDREHRVHREEV